MTDIDKVGIQPEASCALGGPEEGQVAAGVPVDRKTADTMLAALQADSCVLTAEALLESELVHSS
jgi:hypothetical protein